MTTQAIEYRVTHDNRAAWLARQPEWERERVRQGYIDQSARTVAGSRAEPSTAAEVRHVAP